MECVEINPAGNFDSWESTKLWELQKKPISDSLGQKLLFENGNVRVWEVVLLPNERLPFRKSNADCCWISMTRGLAISRANNGKITLIRLKKGDTTFWQSENDPTIFDLENIGEQLLLFHIMEFKSVGTESARFEGNHF
ncbi:hypothetical protein FK220_001960 [Flavobacteriaceae bacterium TP-CH-4]|uniref:Uncharacterized protein n=1 Tax=Pelagihabitans pacificus TaxID=2696054 RepID=A0A967APS3_9FLAO|nr:hypothetical protein [Pelagihabitans pacificus]NHF58088.1 hypothetical protein [Pelagihabitans pacificus]